MPISLKCSTGGKVELLCAKCDSYESLRASCCLAFFIVFWPTVLGVRRLGEIWTSAACWLPLLSKAQQVHHALSANRWTKVNVTILRWLYAWCPNEFFFITPPLLTIYRLAPRQSHMQGDQVRGVKCDAKHWDCLLWMGSHQGLMTYWLWVMKLGITSDSKWQEEE